MNTEKVNQHLIGKSYREIVDNLNVDVSGGDCCGWADYDVTEIPNNVDIEALVLRDCVRIDYENNSSDRVVLNFVFSDKDGGAFILGYELSAGSGSGWSYGAYVAVKLGDEVLAGASW